MHVVRRLAVPLVLVAIAVDLGAQPPPRDQPATPAVTFRVAVDYVEVDAVVTDREGNFVRDLTAADFEVFEDGERQSVTEFALVDLPVEPDPVAPAIGPVVPTDVQSNADPFDGRLYILVLDDYHTQALRSSRVRATARRFVEEHFGANDLAAVVHTSGRSDASQDFTGDRSRLLAAVDQFMGRKTAVQSLERFDILDPDVVDELQLADDRYLDPADLERGFEAQASMRALAQVTRFLNSIQGRRKALVLISEGIDYNIFNPWERRAATTISEEVRQAIAEATRSNTAIYAIDPRGLDSPVGGADTYELADDLDLAFDNPYNRLFLSQTSLHVLADETNGFAFVNSNDFDGALDRIVRDNSTYYLLGFSSTNSSRDGRFREIEVRVSDPDLSVRARKGYVAPRSSAPAIETASAVPGTSDALREVLSSPVPVSGLSLRVSAVPFVGVAPRASVAVVVEVDGDGLTFAERDGRWSNTLELSMLAVDRQGEVGDGDRQEAAMALQQSTYEAVAATGVRFVSRLDLAPGQYQLRVGAQESGGGRIGSVVYDIDVPDLRSERLGGSGLVLTSPQAALMPTAQPDDVFEAVLPAQPTTDRVFTPEDVLVVFAEVYDRETEQAHSVDIATTLIGSDGRPVFQASETRSSAELGGDRGSYGHQVVIPLADVAPGTYVLETRAQSRLDPAVAPARRLAVTVR